LGHYRLSHPVNSPNSLRRPHPPILIGGMGESRTLRLVARYADACNLFDIPDGGKTVRRKLAVLARHCQEVGRGDEDIEKTLSMRLKPDESPDGFARRCSEIAALGIEHIVVIVAGPWTEDAVTTVAAAAGRC
jgi:alkanesulfonate monooxygenase SsuD/methylene tetrahydromethanopterin reductase-like flavin-dependent oxidoreductase (luciferase family)